MSLLQMQADRFRREKEQGAAEARQTAAFFLISGIDLSTALETDGEERQKILLRLERLMERERLKGMRRHWSYDLNRHIALKQALDRMRGEADRKAEIASGGLKQKSGAVRRR